MSTNDTYLAVFFGSKTSPRMKAFAALSDAERRAKEQEGIAAWKTWAERHQSVILVTIFPGEGVDVMPVLPIPGTPEFKAYQKREQE